MCFSGYSLKSLATLIKEYPNYISIAEERPNSDNTTTTRMFYLMSLEDLLKFLNKEELQFETFYNNGKSKLFSVKLNSDNVYEVLTNDRRKVYFDIDATTELTTAQIYNIKEQIDSSIKDYNDVLESDLIALIYSKQENTTYSNSHKSIHMIYPKISICKSENKQLAEHLNTMIKDINIEQNKNIIDTKVYSINQQFCLAYNNKYSKSTWFFPMDSKTASLEKNPLPEYFISQIQNTTEVSFPVESVKIRNKHLRDVINSEIVKIRADKDNIVNLLIEHLPIAFYKNNEYWKQLVRFLIERNYILHLHLFMEHSATVISKQFTQEQVSQEIQKIKNDYTLKSDSILINIAGMYRKYFFISKIKTKVIDWIYSVTNTDPSKCELENKIIEIEEKKLIKPETSFTFNNFKIDAFKATVKQEDGNMYYYPYDSAKRNKMCMCEEMKMCNEISIPIEDIQVDILETLRCNPNDKTLNVVRAMFGSGKTKYIVKPIMECIVNFHGAKDIPVRPSCHFESIEEERATELREAEELIYDYDFVYKNYNTQYNVRILQLTNNNNLNRENTTKLRKAFPDLIIHSHLDKHVDFSKKINIFVCSLDSIIKSKRSSKDPKCRFKYDLVILDEVESLLYYLTHNDWGKDKKEVDPINIYNIFVEILMNATHIVALDADISNERICALQNITGLEPKTFRASNNNFSDYTIEHNDNIEYLPKTLFSNLKNKKRVVICSSCNTTLETVELQILKEDTKYKYIFINKDSKVSSNCVNTTKNDFIENIEYYISHYDIDIFMYSPTLTVGVSIELHHFDILFCIVFDTGCALERVVGQMLFRVRNLADKKMYIFNHNKLFFKKLKDGDNDYYVSEKYNADCLKLNNLKTPDPIYKQIFTNNCIEQFNSEKHFLESFYTRLAKHGFTVNFKTDSTKDTDYKKMNKIRKDQHILELMNCELITWNELNLLNLNKIENEGLSREDKLKVKKFYLYENIPKQFYSRLIDKERSCRVIKWLLTNKDRKMCKYYFENYLFKVDPEAPIKISKKCSKNINIQNTIELLEVFGINKYNNFERMFSKNEFIELIKSNRKFFEEDFNNRIRAIENIEVKSIDSRDTHKYVAEYVEKTLNKVSVLNVKSCVPKLIWDWFGEYRYTTDRELILEYPPPNLNKNKIYGIFITLNGNTFKHTFMNTSPSVKIKKKLNLKFVKKTSIKDSKNQLHRRYIDNSHESDDDVLLQSVRSRKRDVDGNRYETVKIYKDEELNQRKITKWGPINMETSLNEIVKKVTNSDGRTEFKFEDFFKTETVTVHTNVNPIKIETNKNYDIVKNIFSEMCMDELKHPEAQLSMFNTPTAIHPYNYNFDTFVNSKVYNIQIELYKDDEQTKYFDLYSGLTYKQYNHESNKSYEIETESCEASLDKILIDYVSDLISRVEQSTTVDKEEKLLMWRRLTMNINALINILFKKIGLYVYTTKSGTIKNIEIFDTAEIDYKDFGLKRISCNGIDIDDLTTVKSKDEVVITLDHKITVGAETVRFIIH